MAVAELRPMSLGEILDRAFSLYRNHFLLFIGIAALPYLLVLLINLIVQGMQAAPVQIGQDAALTALVAGMGFGLILLVGYWVALVFSQAATVVAVSEVHLGRQTSIGQSYGRVKGHFWQMVGVMISVGLRVLLGLIVFIIPGIYLMLKYSLAIPAAMLEDVGSRQALDRSSTLTEGSLGRIFLIFVMLWILGAVAAVIFQFPVGILIVVARGEEPAAWVTVLSHVADFVANTLVAPLGTIAFALIYYDERVRKEAFDLQLMMQTLDGTTPPGGLLPPPDQGGSVPRQFS